MECMLLQKTRMISLLEQELEHAKQHMSELIHSMTTNSSNNDVSEGSIRRESEISSITVTKSSVDSVDPQDKWWFHGIWYDIFTVDWCKIRMFVMIKWNLSMSWYYVLLAETLVAVLSENFLALGIYIKLTLLMFTII